jgi:hypothetical protein
MSGYTPAMLLEIQGQMYQRARDAAPDLIDALQTVRDELADRADMLDGGEDGPRPNWAMSLLQVVDAALAKAGVK